MKKQFMFFLVLILIVTLLAGCVNFTAAPTMPPEAQAQPTAQIAPQPAASPTLKVIQPAVVPANTPVVVLPTPTAILPSPVLPPNDNRFDVGELPTDWGDNWQPVKQPGQVGVYAVYFPKDTKDVQLQRVVCDDSCLSVKYVTPSGEKDISLAFNWLPFPAGGTSNAALNQVLVARGLNIKDGEALAQNSYAVWLGNVPAGSYILIKAQDNPKLGENVGAYIRIVTTKDDYTTDINDIH